MFSKHIILTLGRSGSNTLVDMLNQHPAIFNFGEVLGEWNTIRKVQRRLRLYRNDDAAYLDALLGNRSIHRAANTFRNMSKRLAGKRSEAKPFRNITSIGIKDFSLNFERYDLLDYPEQARDIRFIGLTRKNVLARMISNEFLGLTGVVSSRTPGTQDNRPTLHIPPEAVLGKLETIESENLALQNCLADLDPDRVLFLNYEDLYTDEARTKETVRQVYAFLDVPDFEPQIRMTKLAHQDPLAAVENHEEIRDLLMGTRFECFLSPTPPAS